jgi:hypothetical protein
VIAVIDDDAALSGTDVGGVPVVSIARATGMKLDAVVLSSDAHEARMWESSEPLRRAGVLVERLYGWPASRTGAAAATR